jgi:hypothetical protein
MPYFTSVPHPQPYLYLRLCPVIVNVSTCSYLVFPVMRTGIDYFDCYL